MANQDSVKQRPAWPLYFAAVVVLAFIAPAPARAEFKGDRELLKLVATQYSANREAIRTWRGKADTALSSTNTVEGKRVAIISRRSTEFAFDKASDKSMFLTRRTGGEGPAESWSTPGRDVWGGILTPEGYFRLFPWSGNQPPNGKAPPDDQRLLTAGPRSDRKRGDFADAFDPFWYLGASGMNMHRRLTGFYDNWNNEVVTKNSTVSVARDQNMVTFLIQNPGVGVNRYVFDLDQGANLVEAEMGFPGDGSIQTRKFAQVAKVWIPIAAEYRQTNGKTGELLESKVKWTENILNGTIPINTFSLDALGIKRGDQIDDKRTKTSYQYAAEGELPELAPEPPSWTRFWVITASIGTAFVMLLGWWMWRRRGSKEAANTQPS